MIFGIYLGVFIALALFLRSALKKSHKKHGLKFGEFQVWNTSLVCSALLIGAGHWLFGEYSSWGSFSVISAAQYGVIYPKLKNPDSAQPDSFKIIDKKTFVETYEGQKMKMTVWFVHGNVTASNSFGGKVKTGYCANIITLDERAGKYLPGTAVECNRDNPTPAEIGAFKNIIGWETVKDEGRSPASN